MRKGEVGIVGCAEGVMVDGHEEVEAFLIAQSEPPPRYLSGSGVSKNDELTDPWALRFGVQDDRFVDDLTGLPLDPDLCRAARAKEIA